MAKMFMYASRAFLVALLCLVVSGAVAVSAQQPSGQNPPKKKKLPPGAKGFEQFAGRDASDKLVTGGATRGECTTYEQLIDCAIGQAGSTPPNIQGAIDFFMQAAKLKPDMFRPHYSLGQIYEEQGNYKEAIAAYKRAVTLKVDESMGEDPNTILSAYYNLANVYAVTNDHAQAIATFQEVIRRLPKVATTHYNVGLSQAALGKHREAIASFNEAIRLKPDYSEAYYNLGVAHSKLEDYPQAIAAFKKALEINPDYAQAHYNLGVAYYMLDDAKSLAGEVEVLQKTQPELAKELAKLNGK
ncbi:MAG TPA: tetratricopeptide repeat protein [Pyrinomonadaceae bacterium]|nr:tetratricopeptide repeat protein [Pyrinomonadaceae bacterium]